MTARLFFAIATLMSGLAVAGGAFAAHALKSQLTEKALTTFEPGIRYQMYHGLALLAVAILLYQAMAESSWLTIAGWSFIIGILLFSGSLYGLSLSGIKWLGAITPLGGVAFLIGWISLGLSSLGMQALR